jgi:hypothetical protein
MIHGRRSVEFLWDERKLTDARIDQADVRAACISASAQAAGVSDLISEVLALGKYSKTSCRYLTSEKRGLAKAHV